MAYFPNGSSGDVFMERWCMNCIHWKLDEMSVTEGCPVWDLHMMGNYDQCKKTDVGNVWKTVLECLIPTKKESCYPDKCRMFSPVTSTPDIPGQMKLEFE